MYTVLRKILIRIQLLGKLNFSIDISGYINHLSFVESFFEFRTFPVLDISMNLMLIEIQFVFLFVINKYSYATQFKSILFELLAFH